MHQTPVKRFNPLFYDLLTLFNFLIMGQSYSEVPIDHVMSFSTTIKQIFAML